MKRKAVKIMITLIFLAGLSLLLYPFISNQWNTYRQNRLIAGYSDTVDGMQEEDFSEEWEIARNFNAQIRQNNLYGDVFGEDDGDLTNTAYWKVLNVSDDGVMGYISIPKISVKLAIYHGAKDEVLQKGAGHMNGTALPIGGESTHSVIAAHRGLPSAKLFTDLDQLEVGDRFYIHVLDQVLAYQVDQILPMVDKKDQTALQDAMQVEEGKDYVTLFTCTPYGINSHRLLVRGTRVEYLGEEDEKQSTPQQVITAVKNYYLLYLIAGAGLTILVIGIIKIRSGAFHKKMIR